ncbi:metalloprotease [Chitinophaga parva]|uniref:Metalloprotease n=1 Tax=Chitinophaga parva TaxID=2169414 RepID=A0A2T7BDV0_9BACT|nr:neutral zinc metallopeptidase [Chitinophaga parva]PUZ23274.1 metalloprotease [Chitinophaga parva]
MRWQNRRTSDNVEEGSGGGGGGRMVIGGGIGTVVIIVLALLFKQNPATVLQQVQQQGTQQAGPDDTHQVTDYSDVNKRFSSVVLASTEDVWHDIFNNMNKTYEEPKLHLFNGSVSSACGMAESATGPFYCPGDHKVYLDTEFFDEMRDKFHVNGDFAMAYVIAHEVGHHVQNLLGISAKMDRARGRMSEAEYNKLSVKLELQADFLAGVWANHAERMDTILEAGDIESALNAASAVGDDRLQKEAQGYVVPDAFTHGTSAQRMYWFKKGFTTGDLRQGDTFSDASLN